jgi:membrane-bound lytic murein transglycosylase B
MGHTQFMPSSWAEFAVDFDGDGKRDIWGPMIRPTRWPRRRNYLRHWGWINGQPWGLEVACPPGFDYRPDNRAGEKPGGRLGRRWASGRGRAAICPTGRGRHPSARRRTGPLPS